MATMYVSLIEFYHFEHPVDLILSDADVNHGGLGVVVLENQTEKHKGLHRLAHHLPHIPAECFPERVCRELFNGQPVWADPFFERAVDILSGVRASRAFIEQHSRVHIGAPHKGIQFPQSFLKTVPDGDFSHFLCFLLDLDKIVLVEYVLPCSGFDIGDPEGRAERDQAV